MKRLNTEVASTVMLKAGVLPLEEFETSNTKWKCKCLTCGRVVFPTHSSIKQNPKSRGCNYCAKERTQAVLRARNYTKAIEFLATFDLEIIGPYTSAKTRSEFQCLRCEEKFSTTYMDLYSGRKVCACKKLPRKSLATSNPGLALELHPTANGLKTAETIGTGVRSNVWWICGNGHEYEASPANRIRGSGCRYCQGMEAYPGETDLLTMHPKLCEELAASEDRKLASKVRPGSNQKLHWRCKSNSNHIYPMSPSDRITIGSGCSYCAGKRISPGDNDFASQFPEAASEWDYERNFPVRPEQVHKGSNTKFAWICSFNPDHKWSASPNSRQNRGCQKCSWFQPGRNDLKTKAQALGKTNLVAEWDSNLNGVGPDQVAYASNDLAYWKCPKFPEKHIYQAKVSNRWFGNSGCPTCAPTAYDANSPGILYFIQNKALGARKIGITNLDAKTKRIDKFVAGGWQVITTYTNNNGLLIRRTEEVMLRRIRDEFELPQFLTQADMRGMSGATETFSDEGVSNEQLLKEINYEYLRAQSKLGVARLDSLVLQ